MGRLRFPWGSALLICWELVICVPVNDEGWALLRFRERVELDPFGALADWNWDGTVDPCSWFGVKCADGRVVALELKNLGLQGTLAPELGKLTCIKSLNLRSNSFSGVIPREIGGLQELEVLDLGYNNLHGILPPELVSIPSLKILVVEGNELMVSITSEVNKLYTLSKLETDDCISCLKKRFLARKRAIRRLLQVEYEGKRGVDKNNKNQERTHTSTITAPVPSPSSVPLFSQSHAPEASPSHASTPQPIFLPPSSSNEVPTAQPSPSPSNFPIPALSTSPTSSYSTSVFLHSPSPIILPPTTSSLAGETGKGQHMRFQTIYLSIVGGISFVVCLAIVFVCCCRATKVVTIRPWSTGLSGQLQKAFVSGVPSLKRSEIEIACEHFSNIIGSLPNCKLYKGTLSSGVEIAVISTLISSSKDWSKQCESQFIKKISALSKVNHKNFINLLGYCAEEEPFTRMMVFEYAPNGTLFEHLHEKEAERLDWPARLRIAMGIAYCLDHMHQLNPSVTIKNLESSSIYLTDDYAAKVSDLTFWSESEEINSPTHNSEQNKTVYRIGLLLIELISGRISTSGNDAQLEIWAASFLNCERPLTEMVDPLLVNFREKDVDLLCDVIRSCINPDMQERLTMAEVAGRLKEITAMTPERVSPALSPLWWAELEILSSESN